MKISEKISVGLLSLAMLFGISIMTTATSKASEKRTPNIRISRNQNINNYYTYNTRNNYRKSAFHYSMHKSVRPTMGNKAALIKQSNVQSRPTNIRMANNFLRHQNHIRITHHTAHTNWFVDGLSPINLKARGWVSWHESRDEWRVLSYGHRCIGYFQLDPDYLGYKNGHVNLSKRHQVKVADAYAKTRYGNWVHAKQFWQIHHWY